MLIATEAVRNSSGSWLAEGDRRLSLHTPSRCGERNHWNDAPTSPFSSSSGPMTPLPPPPMPGKQLIPFSNEPLHSTVVVDCTHPTAFQLTHHLKGNTEKQRQRLLQQSLRDLRGDTSTAAVLNAISERDLEFVSCKHVTSNHFDIDSFLSVFCCINPHIAVKHDQLLRQCARIGDFREFQLPHRQFDDASSESSSSNGGSSGSTSNSYSCCIGGSGEGNTTDCALRIVCWINSVERSKFPLKPFEASFSAASGEEGAMGKFKYFLDHFAFALEHIQAPLLRQEYQEEYQRVLDEYHYLHFGTCHQRNENGAYLRGEEVCAGTNHERYPGLGLCIVRAAEPLHYYSLFSLSIGYDVLLSCYSQNRYELEMKYTTFIDLVSRRSRPRVDLTALVRQLNYLERQHRNGENPELSSGTTARCNGGCGSCASGSAVSSGVAAVAAAPVQWVADSITDSGPLLRLERVDGPKLTKAQRYGHPYERPVLSSAIPQPKVQQLVVSYFDFAYRKSSCAAKRDWSWPEIHEFNRSIDWSEWDQHVSAGIAKL